MEIKFDIYFKKNLGTLFKSNEVDLDGIPAHTNLDLNLVDRLEANYKVGTQKYTDSVGMVDIEERVIQIPFKSDVVKVGLNEFEIVAYMLNGDIKTSQTYTYNIDEAIGEGVISGGSGDGHSHTNLAILNSITQSKVNEWNNKADATHSHSEYASKNHTHNASEIEGLENVDIDLSDYATKNYVDDEISKIELKEGLQGPKGDKGDKGEQGIQGVNGTTPNISIGTVTTLEPGQNATVTRRGTDANPIFDFGIPKGEKGEPGGIFADGGSSDCNNGKPIVEYTHQGNKEIYFTSIDWDTGEAITREPHGLTGKTEIMIVPNDWSPQSYTKNLITIPQEYLRNKNKITVVPNGTNSLFIRQNDGTSTIPVSATDTGNLNIDCTKFHFEIPIAWTIDNIPGDLINYTIVSVGYVKSGGSYRYTKHWYKDEDGNIKEPSYMGVLGHPEIPNASNTHGVYAYQIWDVHIEDGSMFLNNRGVFLGRRNGYNHVVIDSVMENSCSTCEFKFKPQGLVKLATYSNHYAYMSNGTIIRIYGLRG
ncbi:MAG: hypothetical protein IJH55_00100 [Romboutsia sp.]|nr:hypothetical protein [Romboutsia sp.]